jgi:peptidoglycan/LPS O-acetylase OafA/YrhL
VSPDRFVERVSREMRSHKILDIVGSTQTAGRQGVPTMADVKTHEGKITDIQVLRGICILIVIFHHLSISATLAGKFPMKVNMPFFLGVELFFIISGYVVTMSLMKDQFNGFKFIIKRVFRLTPAIVLFLSFSYLVLSHVRQSTLIPEAIKPMFVVADSTFFEQARGILAGYFIVLKESPRFYMNGAMWSLSVEDQFYACIAAISLLAMFSSKLTRIPAKWWVAGVSGALLAVLLRMRWQTLCGHDPLLGKPAILGYLLHWKFDFLPLGVLLAMFDLTFPGRAASFFRDKGPAFTGYLLLVPMAVVAMCESPFEAKTRFLTGLGLPLTAICFGILVLLAGNQCAFPKSHSLLYRVLEYFGNRSYTYYLFHFPVMVVAWIFIYGTKWPDMIQGWMRWGQLVPWKYGVVQAVLATLILVPIVEVVYRFVELPLTRFGKRLVDGRRRKPLAVAAEGAGTLPMPVRTETQTAAAA